MMTISETLTDGSPGGFNPGGPSIKTSTGALTVSRLDKHLENHYEIKDPNIVRVSDTHYMLFASIGNSITQRWLVGRFEAASPNGPWQEIEPVNFVNIEGPQLCAPSVIIERQNGQPLWHMYIQTACFEENGVIAEAYSTDGHTFVGVPEPVISKVSIRQAPAPVVGVYDAAVSEIKLGQETIHCLLYSGYRKVGCGDLYMSYKPHHAADWVGGTCILPQEQVPFHNHPDSEHFEWGLEGAKLIQLADDCFMLIGVCFMPLPDTFSGKRQRVFLAASSTLTGPFVPVGIPFEPVGLGGERGENGHPDTLVIGDTLWVIYQERDGLNKPWYLRTARFDISTLVRQLRRSFATNQTSIHDVAEPCDSKSTRVSFDEPASLSNRLA